MTMEQQMNETKPHGAASAVERLVGQLRRLEKMWPKDGRYMLYCNGHAMYLHERLSGAASAHPEDGATLLASFDIPHDGGGGR